MSPIRVLLADDHTLFRRGLASLLDESADFAVVGEAASGPEAVELADRLAADVVLLDVHMPGGGGVEAVAELIARRPDRPVLMLTVSERDEDLLAAIRAGARGYFLKNAEVEELFDAIRRVQAGEAVLDPDLTGRLFARLAGAPAPSPLTLREGEILALMAAGRTNREIAAQLSVSENTIKTHVARILEKLEARTRSAAVARARREGWLA
jgi:DNA-binding NarL/FixJ family response regulator